MTNEIAIQEDNKQVQSTQASEVAAIIQVIERAAMNPDVDIDKMERLLQMQERVIERNAKAAFNASFARMQTELPAIEKNGKSNNGKYGLWEDIQDGIVPVLSRHGFALSFKTKVENDAITVTAILRHEEGHDDSTDLKLPTDKSGSKNAVQAVGSSVSYGKRYAACALLNIRVGGEDDDGLGSGALVNHDLPTKSSTSLKRADSNGQDAWDRLIKDVREDMVDCHTMVKLEAIKTHYRSRATSERWPRAWMESLGNEFETYAQALTGEDSNDNPFGE